MYSLIITNSKHCSADSLIVMEIDGEPMRKNIHCNANKRMFFEWLILGEHILPSIISIGMGH